MDEQDKSQKFHEHPGILEKVSSQEKISALRTFNPQGAIFEYLEKLKPREKQVIEQRFGIGDGQAQTLEEVGRKLNLTRERVRQIEREAIAKLNRLPLPQSFEQGAELVYKVIEERGNIASEEYILDATLTNNNTPASRKGILFLLEVIPRFNLLSEDPNYRRAWFILGFDQELFKATINHAVEILEKIGEPLTSEKLFGKINEEIGKASSLGSEVLKSFLGVSKKIDQNPYEEWGLCTWPEIHPKDVGDKAYLVLLHHKHPDHYGKITELINKQNFDKRVAHKETVHNELIKDPRFILVGRGIYALKEWGYQSGIVADVIEEVLRKAGKPLSRGEIIEEVLKQRLVKKNTIIVGLSNRKHFQKTQDNKYTNV
jgi:hypothetical protein